MCIRDSPKGLITLEPAGRTMTVRCRNRDKGAAAVKVCKVSCIGCGMCVKACEQGAVTVKDFCAVIDPGKCIGCGKCAQSCKRGAITLQ